MIKKILMPLLMSLALLLGVIGPTEVAFAKNSKSVQRGPASKKKKVKKTKKTKKSKKTSSSKKRTKRNHKY